MIRVRGGLLVLCGAALGAFGLWLLYLTMGWPWPTLVPPDLVPSAAVQGPQGTAQERLFSAPGLAAVVLLAFGAGAGLLGLGMLVFGRRSGALFNLVLALFAVLATVAAVVVVAG